jgi:5-methylthioadenosine/S-adenosylhomocysteine deaminase
MSLWALDDKTINDDEDAVMELRMMHKVHRLHTFDLATPALSAYEALEIATLNGAKATGFADEVGALVPGMKGDAILLDLDRVPRDPWIDPEFDIADAFVERAMGVDVTTVVIGGKIVVENHQPRTIDVEGLYREVRTFCAKGLTPEQRTRRFPPENQTLCAGMVRQLARKHARPSVRIHLPPAESRQRTRCGTASVSHR